MHKMLKYTVLRLKVKTELVLAFFLHICNNAIGGPEANLNLFQHFP